jgi:hypothetical protein
LIPSSVLGQFRSRPALYQPHPVCVSLTPKIDVTVRSSDSAGPRVQSEAEEYRRTAARPAGEKDLPNVYMNTEDDNYQGGEFT